CKEGAVIDEAVARGDGADRGRAREEVVQVRVVLEARPADVIGDDRERGDRGEPPGGFGQVDLLERRRPGVETGAAVRLVHLRDQVGHALVVAGEVMVVLHRERHAELRRAARALLEAGYRVRPETVEADTGALERGEDPDQRAA